MVLRKILKIAAKRGTHRKARNSNEVVNGNALAKSNEIIYSNKRINDTQPLSVDVWADSDMRMKDDSPVEQHITYSSNKIMVSPTLTPTLSMAETPISTPEMNPVQGAAETQTTFRYRPLDHSKPSIRLIKVLPTKSPEGLIQCTIRHSEIGNNNYTCLSYVWGQLHDGGGPFPILMNGRRLLVRHNLHCFLQVASEKYTDDELWIDAVCIAQDNS